MGESEERTKQRGLAYGSRPVAGALGRMSEVRCPSHV